MKKAIQLFLILTGSFFLVMFLIPIIFVGIINTGNLAGIFFSVTLILIGVYLNSVCKFFNKLCRKTFGKLLTAILCVVVCISFGLGAYASYLLISMFSIPASFKPLKFSSFKAKAQDDIPTLSIIKPPYNVNHYMKVTKRLFI